MASMRLSICSRRFSVIGIAYKCYALASTFFRGGDGALDGVVGSDQPVASGVLALAQLHVVLHGGGWPVGAHRASGRHQHRARHEAASRALQQATPELSPTGH